jgi:hypothetical protein
MIRYTGACIEASAVLASPPDGYHPGCVNGTWTTVIDASTGKFIHGYTDG